MDLRKTSRAIVERELRPYFLRAIQIHPNPVDIKLLHGNVVTLRDYARRIMISLRRDGIDKFTAKQVCALKPRLRIYYNSQGGITIAGLNQKYVIPKHWDNYKLPFKVIDAADARWTTLAINPSEDEIAQMASLISRDVLETPIELQTKFTQLQVKKIIDDAAISGVHVFKFGRNVMMWPRRVKEK